MQKIVLSLSLLLLTSIPGLAFAGLDDYFVSTDWLAAHRDQVVVVDVRQTPLFLLGHISGAQHVPRDEFLETRNGVKSLVPGVAKTHALLSRLGASPTTPVVVYAEDDNPYAARLVWSLQYNGHKNAYVLDGGYDKWSAENRSTSLLPTPAATPVPYPGSVDPGYLSSRAGADYVYTRLENPGVVVWDTRRTEEYVGSEVRANRGGHIPGATHLNWTNLQTEVNGIKVLKKPAEIIALLNSKGITSDKEIIAHCQTGIRSSYATLVLLGLGYQRVSNYDGSWIEWANNPTLPIINAQGKLETEIHISLDQTREAQVNKDQEVTQ
ncbi:sulfurtransferase [Pelobacter seleniigenes]|uniref:sulfurtransferase n=1 Tax=Pelobacter seleniigenes TaxID=407188 RepID=UPI0006922083|nr:rhodanese-like domain-containing protein [Pelobacter seleniigenes]